MNNATIVPELPDPKERFSPKWVKFWISDMMSLMQDCWTPNGVDKSKFFNEQWNLCNAFVTGDFSKSPRALKMWREACQSYGQKLESGRKGVEARKKAKRAAAKTARDAAKEQLKAMIEADKRKKATPSIKVDGVDVENLPY